MAVRGSFRSRTSASRNSGIGAGTVMPSGGSSSHQVLHAKGRRRPARGSGRLGRSGRVARRSHHRDGHVLAPRPQGVGHAPAVDAGQVRAQLQQLVWLALGVLQRGRAVCHGAHDVPLAGEGVDDAANGGIVFHHERRVRCRGWGRTARCWLNACRLLDGPGGRRFRARPGTSDVAQSDLTAAAAVGCGDAHLLDAQGQCAPTAKAGEHAAARLL